MRDGLAKPQRCDDDGNATTTTTATGVSITMPFPGSFVGPWTEQLRSARAEQADDLPSYYVDRPESLTTTCVPKALYVGTGLSIFNRALLPAILNAKESIHFVTCYWADSPTLNSFRETLLNLSASRLDLDPETTTPLRITIGFSSRGLLQKLLHTSSTDGYVYPPSQWAKLGLPDEAALKMGCIDLTVKSLFFTPFSVMHPKYLVVDGARAWMPSCNVSWEAWFEGCIEFEGDAVQQVLAFHDAVWCPGQPSSTRLVNLSTDEAPAPESAAARRAKRTSLHTGGMLDSATQSFKFTDMKPVPAVFLPSPHHRNPRFRLLPPFFATSNPPVTPLNNGLLTLIANAQHSISIVTPNVTAWPLMDALLEAIARGVDVEIRTNKNMMVNEQLVTAGTTTSRCIERFIKKYQGLVARTPKADDPEAQLVAPGRLDIFDYQPLESRLDEKDEPVLSHFKMTMVDGEYVVFGSGNMDRASWWTSQEIGLLLHVPGFEGRMLWEGVLGKRGELWYSSR
jgi:phosphatidylserine/phosphatidylglycerophosphate/cardiolipin synthase-like enzyme